MSFCDTCTRLYEPFERDADCSGEPSCDCDSCSDAESGCAWCGRDPSAHLVIRASDGKAASVCPVIPGLLQHSRCGWCSHMAVVPVRIGSEDYPACADCQWREFTRPAPTVITPHIPLYAADRQAEWERTTNYAAGFACGALTALYFCGGVVLCLLALSAL